MLVLQKNENVVEAKSGKFISDRALISPIITYHDHAHIISPIKSFTSWQVKQISTNDKIILNQLFNTNNQSAIHLFLLMNYFTSTSCTQPSECSILCKIRSHKHNIRRILYSSSTKVELILCGALR